VIPGARMKIARTGNTANPIPDQSGKAGVRMRPSGAARV
jgi:hypothetical protein